MAHVEEVPTANHCAAELPNPMHPNGPDLDEVPAASARPPHPPDPTSPVIDGVEDDGVWRRYRAETLATLGPVGFDETELAEAIALLSWRLRRVGRLEADTLADGFARQSDEAAGSRGRRTIGGCERVLAVICRYEGRLERARDRAVKELRALQQARRAAVPAAPEPANTPHPSTTPSPDAGAVGSFRKMAESLAGDRRPGSPDPSEPLAWIGKNAGAAARGGSAPGPEPETDQGTELTQIPDAVGPGMVASFGKTTGLAPSEPLPAPPSRSGRASVGPAPGGAVASFRQLAPDATEPPGGWLTWQGPGPYVEEEGEEDEWTYSSYKAYWAEHDAAARAAREAGEWGTPGDLKAEDDREPG